TVPPSQSIFLVQALAHRGERSRLAASAYIAVLLNIDFMECLSIIDHKHRAAELQQRNVESSAPQNQLLIRSMRGACSEPIGGDRCRQPRCHRAQWLSRPVALRPRLSTGLPWNSTHAGS